LGVVAHFLFPPALLSVYTRPTVQAGKPMTVKRKRRPLAVVFAKGGGGFP
jgi:hypothetical protein